jgi:hypothetical protein
MLHFISQGAWSNEAVLGEVREMVVPEMERHGIAKVLFPEFALPKDLSTPRLPLRPERHVPNSIATMRRRLIAKLPMLWNQNKETCTL